MNSTKFSKSKTNLKSTVARGFLILGLTGWLLVSMQTPAWADEARGTQVRNFMRDVILASGGDETKQAEALRLAFSQHPEIFQWVAEGHDLDELLKDAEFGGLHPSVMSNREIISKVQKEAQGKVSQWIQHAGFQNNVIEAAANRALTASPEELSNELKQNPQLEAAARDKAKIASKMFAELPPEQRLKALRVVDDDPFKEVAKEVNKSLMETKLSEADAVHLITSSDAFKLDGVDPAQMQEYLGKYFDEIPLQDRREMIAAVLKLPPGAPLEKQLSAVLQNSGPAMQKLFQLIGKDAKSPLVLNVMAELKESIAPVPFEQVRPIVEKNIGGRIEDVFASFDQKHLAAATIGQAHRATLKSGEDVIVKIRRPGIVDEVAREMAVIKKVAAGTNMEKVTAQIKEGLETELDFRIEAQNLELGGRAYTDPKLGLTVAKRVEGFAPAEDMLVTYLADGKSMAKLDLQPAAMAAKGNQFHRANRVWMNKAMKALLEKWFDTALFGSGVYAEPSFGFFHGDLHGGNRFMKRLTGKIMTGEPNYKLTVIDFGYAGTLTLEQRRAFVQLTIAAGFAAPEEMLNALSRISTMTPEKRALVLAAAKDIKWSQMDISTRIQKILELAIIDGGLKIPTQFLGFKRAEEFLTSEIEKMNEQLNIFDKARKLPRVDPTEVMVKVAAKRLSVDIPKQFFSSTVRANTSAPIGEISGTALRAINERIGTYFGIRRSCVQKAVREIAGEK